MFDRFPPGVRSTVLCLAMGGSALVMAGCQPSGSRGGQGGEYTRYVMSLYNDPAAQHGLRTVEFPVNVAAAQIGEAAPQPDVLNKLRNAHDVFAKVESLPAEAPSEPAAAVQGREPVRRLESLARDQGADYLLIYGATVETRTRTNSAAVVDLTIVGAYAPGTRNVSATARGSAVLVDVRTGNVVLSAGAEAKGNDFGSAASADGVADALSEKVHDESLLKLADQVVAVAQRRAREEATADDLPAAGRAIPALPKEK